MTQKISIFCTFGLKFLNITVRLLCEAHHRDGARADRGGLVSAAPSPSAPTNERNVSMRGSIATATSGIQDILDGVNKLSSIFGGDGGSSSGGSGSAA